MTRIRNITQGLRTKSRLIH